jgi:hypothetical protein
VDVLPPLNICLWIPYTLSAKSEGKTTIEFKVIPPDSKKARHYSMELELPKNFKKEDSSAVIIKGVIIPCDKEGMVEVKYKIKDQKNWVSLKKIPLKIIKESN